MVVGICSCWSLNGFMRTDVALKCDIPAIIAVPKVHWCKRYLTAEKACALAGGKEGEQEVKH